MSIERLACKLKDLGPRAWHRGSALYRIGPPVYIYDNGTERAVRHIIIAFTPVASDHGKPETTVFHAQSNGRVYKDWPLDSHVEMKHARIVGKNDHAAALAKIGYALCSSLKKVDQQTKNEATAIKRLIRRRS